MELPLAADWKETRTRQIVSNPFQCSLPYIHGPYEMLFDSFLHDKEEVLSSLFASLLHVFEPSFHNANVR